MKLEGQWLRPPAATAIRSPNVYIPRYLAAVALEPAELTCIHHHSKDEDVDLYKATECTLKSKSCTSESIASTVYVLSYDGLLEEIKQRAINSH